MLEETLEILHGLWDEPDGWSFIGKHYAIDDALFRPKPGSVAGRNDGRPRILVGGEGSPRSFRIAARYADEFNLSSASPTVATQKYAALDATLCEAGRDPRRSRTRRWSGCSWAATDEEVRGREQALLTAFGQAEAGEAWFEPRRARWIHGTPDKARASLAAFEAAGVERIMLQDFLPRDLEMIELAAEVAVRRGRGRRASAVRVVGELGGAEVARVLAADEVGVRAAGRGDRERHQLERARGAEE